MAPTEKLPVERPIAAFVLSLLAGLGLLARSGMMHGGMHGGWQGPMGRWPGDWGPHAFAVGWPWLAPIAGVVLLAAAVALYVRPEARRGWGAVILVTSGLHLLLGMGGFLASVLGIVGGSLAFLGGRPTPSHSTTPSHPSPERSSP